VTTPPSTRRSGAGPSPTAWRQRPNPGSSREWRKLRAAWAAVLPVPCWRCREYVYPDPPGTPRWATGWHLGHPVDLALGGEFMHAAPEHRDCNLSAGGRLGARRVHGEARPGPSRAW
jgi:hypothetical protein